MSIPLDQIAQLLLDYWADAGTADPRQRNHCRRLAGMVQERRPLLSPLALKSPSAATRAEVRAALEELAGGDLQAIALIQALAPAAPPEPARRPPERSVALALRLLPRSDGATVLWETANLGSHQSHLTPPYEAEALPAVLRALDAAQTGGAGVTTADLKRLRALGLARGGRLLGDIHRLVGRALHAALTADPEGRVALHTARSHAAAQGCALSLRLHFPPDAITLAALPWELLWDGQQPLLLGGGAPGSCVRHLDIDRAAPPPGVPGQRLRILVVAPQAGADPARREADRAGLMAALHALGRSETIAVEELPAATREALTDAVQRAPADILHIVGQGRYADGKGQLLLDAPGGGSVWVPAERLASLLGQTRLALLHAGQTAAVGGGGLLTGVATALSAAGVPAVIGMQLSVRPEAAARFTTVVYRELARGAGIQQAVALGRQALYAEEDDEGGSWYVPTLTLRTGDSLPLRLR